MRTIVVSAVTLRKGGTLTILRKCLSYLSTLVHDGEFEVIALVHKRELCDYPGIEYIEMPEIVGNWGKRLWCEYVTMKRISKQLAPVYLWLSLHDTTPQVIADRQAVYCQTSFPFMKMRLRDLKFDYKIVLFTLFTRLAYSVNIKKNKYLIVQAEWLRDGFSKMFNLPRDRFIVAPPERQEVDKADCASFPSNMTTFLFAATPDCHKNFELICEAASRLEHSIGKGRFKVVFTIDGTENKYSHWLKSRYGHIDCLEFAGYMSKERLYKQYAATDCLVFPSRVETWGLPISEFSVYGKPMLLADLPYAHETAKGSTMVAFFNVDSPEDLKKKMEMVVNSDYSVFRTIENECMEMPFCPTWKALFDVLLA